MWETVGNTDLLLVTANAYVKTDGNLVMGRGAALECATKFPYAPHDFGRAIEQRAARMGFYGVIILPKTIDDHTHLGIFQVKYNWSEDASSQLIRQSAAMLGFMMESLVSWRVVMNYPGIGNGRLSKDQVSFLIEDVLPDNVEVWER